MSEISLASSPFTAGNVLPNTLTVNTGGNSHLYASKQAGGQTQKQQKKKQHQKQQKKKQQSRKNKKQSRKSSKKSRQSRKN